MGMSPAQVDECTVWEFLHALDGWQKANGVEETTPAMDDERLAELGIVGF